MPSIYWKNKIRKLVRETLDKVAPAEKNGVETNVSAYANGNSPQIDGLRQIKLSDGIVCNLILNEDARGKSIKIDVAALIQSKAVEALAQQMRETPVHKDVWPVTLRYRNFASIANPYCDNETGFTAYPEDSWRWVFNQNDSSKWAPAAAHLADTLTNLLLPELYKLNNLDAIIDSIYKSPRDKGLHWESYISAIIIAQRFDLLRQELRPIDESKEITTFARNALNELRKNTRS